MRTAYRTCGRWRQPQKGRDRVVWQIGAEEISELAKRWQRPGPPNPVRECKAKNSGKSQPPGSRGETLGEELTARAEDCNPDREENYEGLATKNGGRRACQPLSGNLAQDGNNPDDQSRHEDGGQESYNGEMKPTKLGKTETVQAPSLCTGSTRTLHGEWKAKDRTIARTLPWGTQTPNLGARLGVWWDGSIKPCSAEWKAKTYGTFGNGHNPDRQSQSETGSLA